MPNGDRSNDTRADYRGAVRNFSNAEISNNGIPYFEFALTLPPPPDPPHPPIEKVLYTDLGKSFAPAVVLGVVMAWANRTVLDVYCDHAAEKDRVRGVVPFEKP